MAIDRGVGKPEMREFECVEIWRKMKLGGREKGWWSRRCVIRTVLLRLWLPGLQNYEKSFATSIGLIPKCYTFGRVLFSFQVSMDDGSEHTLAFISKLNISTDDRLVFVSHRMINVDNIAELIGIIACEATSIAEQENALDFAGDMTCSLRTFE